MDAPDIDLHKFADSPFVIERPAEPSLLADGATRLLALRGMRMSFGSDLADADAVVRRMTRDAPAGFGVLDRQRAAVASVDVRPTTVVAGPARPAAVKDAPDRREAMLLDAYRMAGHGLLGSDRGQAAAFAVMTGVQKGFRPESLRFFSDAQSRWEPIAPITGRASATLAYLAAQATRMRSGIRFVSYSPAEMGEIARRFAQDSGTGGALLRFASLGGTSAMTRAEPAPASASPGPQSGPKSGGEIDSQAGVFPVKPFGSQPDGPSWLPPSEFSQTSLAMVQGVHPDLLRVIARARQISKVPFEVVPRTGGVRDEAEQASLKAKGASHAKLGRHTIGYAVDLVPVNARGRVDFADLDGFDGIRDAMEQAANDTGVPVTWGGNWKRLVDRPHFELDRYVYPGPGEEPKPGELVTAFR